MARKKELKKAEFKLLENCFHRDQGMAGQWKEVFGNEYPVTFELGCGKADFSYGMAERFPERNFVGVDLKMDRMWYAAQNARGDKVSNLAMLFTHLLQIDECVAEGEADELWITFPDPYPKNRQAKHRMVNASFLDKYRKVLRPGGKVHYKTDNLDLFHYSLEVFVAYPGLRLQDLSFDLHENDHLPAHTKITTHYERQFMEMGKKINYVSFTFDR
ncbi:MAG: tRNA (guanosine(46)-N7)-methyltransferase TrmB [Bacteroidota bacterium]